MQSTIELTRKMPESKSSEFRIIPNELDNGILAHGLEVQEFLKELDVY